MTTKTFDTFKEMREMYCGDTDHHLLDKIVRDALEPKIKLAYCDYIANLVSTNLKAEDVKDKSLLASVGRMKYDLDANGAFRSTTKTVMVEDRNGKQYIITVEEA
jgi:hypothetical protein